MENNLKNLDMAINKLERTIASKILLEAKLKVKEVCNQYKFTESEWNTVKSLIDLTCATIENFVEKKGVENEQTQRS